MSESSKRDTADDPNDSREEAPKKKARVASLIDDQAAESGSENGGSDSEMEDQNEYDTRDGFVVNSDNSDESDPESDPDADSDDDDRARKPALKNLKRKKEGTKVDLDELDLIRENLEDAGRDDQVNEESDAGDDEIAPEVVHEGTVGKVGEYPSEDENSEDEMDGFIVDDERDGEAIETEEERAERRARQLEERAARKKMEGTRAGGPTRQQLEDAMEIFGDGYDEFDFNDEEEEEEDGEDSFGGAGSAAEKKKLNKIRSAFEHSDLVESFCTAEDDLVRSTDVPERLQAWIKGRAMAPPGPGAGPEQIEQLGPEARWVCTKLVDKIYDERDPRETIDTNRFAHLTKADMTSELLTPVLEVLKLLLVEHMEVPFIATYRRDYIHPLLTSRYLWHILNLDAQYADFVAQREHLLMEYQVFQEVAVQLQAGGELCYRNVVAEELEEALKCHEALVEEHAMASGAVNRCMDVVDGEDATDADRESVVQAEAALEDINSQLASNEASLQSCKDRAPAQQKRKRIFDSADRIAVAQLMALMPFNQYENMIRFCEDEAQLVDIRNYMLMLEHGSAKTKIKRTPKAAVPAPVSVPASASAQADHSAEPSSAGVSGGRVLSTTAGTSISRTGRIIKKQAVVIANDSSEDDDEDFEPEPEPDMEKESGGEAVGASDHNLFGDDDDDEKGEAGSGLSSPAVMHGSQGLGLDEEEDDDVDGSNNAAASGNSHRGSANAPVPAPAPAAKKRLGRATAKDAYCRVRKIPGVREFAALFTASATQCGQCLRYGASFKTECATPVDGVEALALKYMELANDSGGNAGSQKKLHFLSVDEFIVAVKTLVATELANEPSVRGRARDNFRAGATVSTTPTAKGAAELHPFHELFGISMLTHKPLHEMLHDPRDRTLFLRLLKAETDGLITVQLNPPPVRDLDGRATNESDDYMRHLQSVYLPSMRADLDVDPETRASWDKLRLSVLSECIDKHLTPQLQTEAKRELVRLSREAVVEECAQKFESMLKIGPCRYDEARVHEAAVAASAAGAGADRWDRDAQDAKMAGNALADTAKVLLDCPPEGTFRCSVMSFFLPQVAGKEPVGCCFMDADGVVRAQSVLPVEAAKSALNVWVKKYLAKYRPPLIIINSSGGRAAISLQNNLTRQMIAEVSRQCHDEIRQRKEEREAARDFGRYAEYDQMHQLYTAQVLIVEDSIAQIFKGSKRSKSQFPEYYPAVCGAISLGRFVLEPLTEYCGLWQSVDALGNFGYEALFLNLHPLKNCLKGTHGLLLRALERVLVDTVCSVGVDINLALAYPHYATLLGFVGGLGLRKAHALLQGIRNTSIGSVVDSRKILLERKLMGRHVYNNSAGFIRVSRETAITDEPIDPLDNTRIHPECYITHDFAVKICADALEVDAPPKYFAIVTNLMDNSREVLEQLLLCDKPKSEAEKDATPQKPKPPTVYQTDLKREWLTLWNKGGRPADTWSAFNPSTYPHKNASNADKFYTQLRDHMFELDLETFADHVLKSGLGRRLQQFNDIKEELRYPWLDTLRMHSPLRPPDADLLFRLSTGGERFDSLYVGMRVSCSVKSVEDNKAQLMIDDGIKGFVHISNVSDERLKSVHEVLAPGMLVAGVIIRVNKDRANVEVATKTALLKKSEAEWMGERFTNVYVETWMRNSDSKLGNFDPSFDERGALALYAQNERKRQEEIALASAANSGLSTKNESINSSSSDRVAGPGAPKGAAKVTRMVFHPLFSNCNYKEAEEKLRSREVGDVIIRPSSKGDTGLSVTWAFQRGMYLHIAVEERGKLPGDTFLGKELCVEGVAEPYSDLDELYSRYIVPMNEFVALMVAEEKFREGNPDAVRELLEQAKRENPARTPYFVHCDARRCCFQLSWLIPQSSNPMKSLTIRVTPDGYMICPPNGGATKIVPRALEVFNFMKKMMMAPAPKPMPMPVYGGPAPSAGVAPRDRDPKRTNRFSDTGPAAIPPPPMPPRAPTQAQVEQVMPASNRLAKLRRPPVVPSKDDQWD